MSDIKLANDDLENTGLATVDETFGSLATDEGGGDGYIRMPKVSFFSSYAKEPRLTKLKEAGVKLGQFYLEDGLGITAIDPFKVFATPGIFSCYCTFDNKGKVTGARLKTKGGWQPDRGNPADKGWKEHTLAVVLVPLGTAAITAAFLETSSAVERLWKPIREAFALAENPAAFAARSPLHAAAAKASHPWGRFVASIDVYEEPGKNDPSAKNVIGRAQISPTPEVLVGVFNDYVKSPAAALAMSIFKKRQQKLVDLANGVVKPHVQQVTHTTGKRGGK